MQGSDVLIVCVALIVLAIVFGMGCGVAYAVGWSMLGAWCAWLAIACIVGAIIAAVIAWRLGLIAL